MTKSEVKSILRRYKGPVVSAFIMYVIIVMIDAMLCVIMPELWGSIHVFTRLGIISALSSIRMFFQFSEVSLKFALEAIGCGGLIFLMVFNLILCFILPDVWGGTTFCQKLWLLYCLYRILAAGMIRHLRDKSKAQVIAGDEK